MTRTKHKLTPYSPKFPPIPELVSFSPRFSIPLVGGHLTHDVRFNVEQAHIHGVPSLESRFELGALRPRSWDTFRLRRCGPNFSRKLNYESSSANSSLGFSCTGN
ncbi:hypothetical protein AVEN_4692-1 [Araneus ventricosus]|uniref:Uncharacterized protein n=1 Tax=Araneus ventricosus TaxID=182803 RepID=A0A4Y2LUP2_ARAVE|nr:hypothetical protein AVEN_4692-1 [Araneus ventricosus]